MTPYEQMIVQATECTPEQADAVEAAMRDKFHTLDGLSRMEFNKEARKAFRQLYPQAKAEKPPETLDDAAMLVIEASDKLEFLGTKSKAKDRDKQTLAVLRKLKRDLDAVDLAAFVVK